MMLPDRHIHIDARQLQAIFDAERERSGFSQLRADLRAMRLAGDPPLLVSLAIICTGGVVLALLTAMARGMA